MRNCGDCQLCCRLLPVPPLLKKAGQRCKHQKFGVGCAVYGTARMPPECRLWSCRWLVSDDTGDVPRPDRCHYVIDVMPDFVTCRDNETGEEVSVQVVQVWCDPRHRDAHRDPHLRRYLYRRGEEGIGAIIRFDSQDAIAVMPPQLCADGEWHEVSGQSLGRTHSFGEVLRAVAGVR
jgi:hypothetical protein